MIDVKTGNSLGEHSLKRFLDGYNTVLKRLKDENGQPAVARVSGWPGASGDEFKDILPGIPSPPRARLSCFLAAEDRLTIFRYDTDSAHFSHRPPLPRPTASFVAFE